MISVPDKRNSRLSRRGFPLLGGAGYNPKAPFLGDAEGILYTLDGDLSTKLYQERTGAISGLTPAALGDVVGTIADVSGNDLHARAPSDAARGVRGQFPYGGLLAGSSIWAGLLPGASGDYFSTPDSAALDITGDIEIVVHAAAEDWTPATANQRFLGKRQSGGQASYSISLNTDGTVTLVWSEDGSTFLTAVSTVGTGFTDGDDHWLKFTLDVDDGVGGREVIIYTSTDGVSWSQLGDPITGAATSIFNSSSQLEVGGVLNGTTNRFIGKIYRAQVYDGIGGTLVADFNPTADYVAGLDKWTSTTGEVWSINGAARIVSSDLVYTSASNMTIPGVPSVPCIYCAGTQYYTIPDSDVLTFPHDGTGMFALWAGVVNKADDGADDSFISSRNASTDTGFGVYIEDASTANANLGVYVSNGTTDIIADTGSASDIPRFTPAILSLSYNTSDDPDAVAKVDNTTKFSGDDSGTPGSGSASNDIALMAEPDGTLVLPSYFTGFMLINTISAQGKLDAQRYFANYQGSTLS